jgi:hypothetical protein
MNGIRFYLEYESPKAKRNGEHSGNVFAAFVDLGWHMSSSVPCREGLGAVLSEPNSPVCTTSASMGYLSDKCKRISETKARQIHPALFATLDNS